MSRFGTSGCQSLTAVEWAISGQSLMAAAGQNPMSADTVVSRPGRPVVPASGVQCSRWYARTEPSRGDPERARECRADVDRDESSRADSERCPVGPIRTEANRHVEIQNGPVSVGPTLTETNRHVRIQNGPASVGLIGVDRRRVGLSSNQGRLSYQHNRHRHRRRHLSTIRGAAAQAGPRQSTERPRLRGTRVFRLSNPDRRSHRGWSYRSSAADPPVPR